MSSEFSMLRDKYPIGSVIELKKNAYRVFGYKFDGQTYFLKATLQDGQRAVLRVPPNAQGPEEGP